MRSKRSFILMLFLIVSLFVLLFPIKIEAVTPAKNVMIIVPHPDDETLMAAGVIENAKNMGTKVQVVVVTNGDFHGEMIGHERINETISAMKYLGLDVGLKLEQDKDNVIFLGYPDNMLKEMYYDWEGKRVFTGLSGRNMTYANSLEDPVPKSSNYNFNLKSVPHSYVEDYHKSVYGTSTFYTRENLLNDIKDVIMRYKPQDIYVTSAADYNDDHKVTYKFVTDALNDITKDSSYIVKLHEGIIHGGKEWDEPHWPSREIKYLWGEWVYKGTQLLEFTSPSSIDRFDRLKWEERESITVPDDMQTTILEYNRKFQAILHYPSQQHYWSDFNNSFVKRDEFFWVTVFSGQGKIGDLNGDDKVDSTDLTLMKRYLLCAITDFPVENDLWAADVNGDRSIDSTDLTWIKKYILRIVDTFPKESNRIATCYK